MSTSRATVIKEISSDKNWEEAFWETSMWSVHSPHRDPPFSSCSCLLTFISWYLISDVWERIDGNSEKGNIFRQKLKRSILRNCIVTSECYSQTYTFLFIDQCANTVFLKSAVGYFFAQWSLLRQRKYLQMKSRKTFWETTLWCVNSNLWVTAVLHGALC